MVYTENDALWLNGAFLKYKMAEAGKTVYFSLADYSATIGSDFVQNVEKVTSPTPATLTVAEGVTVSSTMYYQAKSN